VLRVWIGFEQRWAIARLDRELVQASGGEIRNEKLPDAGVSQQLHLVRVTVPTVEVTNDAHARSVWRPNREGDAFCATLLRDVRAEFFVDLFVATFAEEMQINLADHC
jgi:hypothetical protein